ncbi:hypothetical protein ACH495_15125 [Micromonospora sp. NPDC018662]|uniref:hypothetical protein n=1 Tax=Micromonospora sp. NPDC018662 TaxID=3364238 RepID=UPI00379C83AF
MSPRPARAAVPARWAARDRPTRPWHPSSDAYAVTDVRRAPAPEIAGTMPGVPWSADRAYPIRPADLRRPGSSIPVWLPLRLALAWLLGTFAVFWLTEPARRVENPGQLCTFVLSATALFAMGYAARIRRRRPLSTVTGCTADQLRGVRQLVLAGAIYYGVLNLARLRDFGATGPQSVWASIQDPATAYANKFDVYQQNMTSGSALLALLMPLGVLSTVLVPLLVVHWRELPAWLRLAGFVGTALHLAFYLFIGTMKGLGDVAIMVVAGLLVAVATARRRGRAGSRSRLALLLVAGVCALTATYMVHSHAMRAAEFGSAGALVRASPAVERAVGPDTAEGVAALIGYPTHGYLGLSYNLRLPFEWSRGLGSAPAATMLAEDAVGVDPTAHPTYPDRTEEATGWPARLYWATIYPWLASDLTFVGAALFMGLVGWLFASSWCAALTTRRVVPTVIFGQVCILIVYVPANNQLGMAPESVVGIVTLLALYLIQRPTPGHPPAAPAGRTRRA